MRVIHILKNRVHPNIGLYIHRFLCHDKVQRSEDAQSASLNKVVCSSQKHIVHTNGSARSNPHPFHRHDNCVCHHTPNPASPECLKRAQVTSHHGGVPRFVSFFRSVFTIKDLKSSCLQGLQGRCSAIQVCYSIAFLQGPGM